MKIRKAKISDVKKIHKLLTFFATRKELLGRSLSELYEGIQRFYVATDKNKVIGCCSLYVTWENLCEVKSLAVAQKYHGRGIGKKLLMACLKEARELGLSQVFCLTLQGGFFKSQGFRKISKNDLPHKVWTECVKCPFFPDSCIEIAMVRKLTGSRNSRVNLTLKGTKNFIKESMIPAEPRS